MTDPTGAAFWEGAPTRFPSLKGAASTAYYFECERSLIEAFFPALEGQRILKTDLWDEAKNTEILKWTAERGARPFGIDISLGLAREARETLSGHAPGVVVADVRALPFRPGSFDLIYSMGTIEHFPETDQAARELFAVLRPGGRAIIGVLSLRARARRGPARLRARMGGFAASAHCARRPNFSRILR